MRTCDKNEQNDTQRKRRRISTHTHLLLVLVDRQWQDGAQPKPASQKFFLADNNSIAFIILCRTFCIAFYRKVFVLTKSQFILCLIENVIGKSSECFI